MFCYFNGEQLQLPSRLMISTVLLENKCHDNLFADLGVRQCGTNEQMGLQW